MMGNFYASYYPINSMKEILMATSSKKTITPPSARTTPTRKTAAVTTEKAEPVPAKKVSSPKTEKPTRKKAATEKSKPKKSVKKNTVSPEERYQMIATAAYFHAQQRGFVCCCEKQDWICGEAEIDAMLTE